MEKILFIASDFKYKGSLSKIKQSQNKFIQMVNNSSMDSGNAFFINSLKTIGNLSVVFGEENAIKLISEHRFAIIGIDLKLFLSEVKSKSLDLLNSSGAKIILYISFDGNFSRSFNVSKINDYLNIDAIFVTNLLKDLNEYNLDSNIEKKMHSSFLGLGYLGVRYDTVSNKFMNLPLSDNKHEKKYDVFFAGSISQSKKIRVNVISRLEKDERIKSYNFFLKHFKIGDGSVPLNNREFYKKLKSSLICLDLSGNYDNLTMRFNEIILCGELPIVDYGFKKFSVSSLYENIIDEILFNNNDELFNFIDEYKDIKKRERIKVEINNIFNQYYRPQIHGEYIQSRI